jgi:hypothetical protein
MLLMLAMLAQDFVTGPPDAGTVVTRGTFGVENVTGPGHVSGCVCGVCNAGLLPTCSYILRPVNGCSQEALYVACAAFNMLSYPC